MSKFEGTVTLKNSEGEKRYPIQGIKRDHQFHYLEEEKHVTLSLFPSRIELERTSDDVKMWLSFEKGLTTTGIYDIKCDGMSLELPITTSELIVEPKRVLLTYTVSDQEEISFEFCFQEMKV